MDENITAELANRAFGRAGCQEYGIVVREGASSWGAHESGRITIPYGSSAHELPIAYDEREAPYVVGPDGHTEARTLVSLSDEEDRLACAWAVPAPGSSLLGVGIDLASARDFGGRPGTERFVELMFSARERDLARGLYADDAPLSLATLFGAKEAAFKSTARPLRRWYRTHGEQLCYEVRDFGMTEPGVERGELRRGAAQAALDRMGVGRIEVHHARVGSMALVVALAFSA